MLRVFVLGFAIACSLYANTIIDLGNFAIDAKSSILFANMNPAHPDRPSGPVFINLDALAQANHIGPNFFGYTLDLLVTGNICYIQPASGTCPSIPMQGLLGAFDVDNNFVPGANDPLPGAIATTSGVTDSHPITFYDNLSTAGGPNFLIPNNLLLSVLVPESAHFLAIGLYDSFFGDNSGTLMLNIKVDPADAAALTPEPMTALLSFVGLSALLAARRIRRRS